MTKKTVDIIGIVVGVIMIAFAVVAFAAIPDFYNLPWIYHMTDDLPYPSEIQTEHYTSYESDKAYGGDAYTGIQQAAAQAANNLIAVDEKLEVSNEYLFSMNEGLSSLNRNIFSFSYLQSQQFEAITSYLSLCLGLAFAAAGLLTIIKHMRNLCKESSPKAKKKNNNPEAWWTAPICAAESNPVTTSENITLETPTVTVTAEPIALQDDTIRSEVNNTATED